MRLLLIDEYFILALTLGSYIIFAPMKVTSFPIAGRKLFVLEVGRTYGNLKLLQELRLVLK